MADILPWARRIINEEPKIHWTRGGLSKEQVERYGLPLSVEGHGYQWEALSDEQAREIIEETIGDLIDEDAIEATVVREDKITARFKERFDRLFGLQEGD